MPQIIPRSARASYLVAGLAVGAALFAVSIAVLIDDAFARRKPKVAKNLSVVPTTPLGLQGTAGAGSRLALPFNLVDRSRRKVGIVVEFGIDLNGDGEIADGTSTGKPSEFVRATHEFRDARDTARVRRGDGRTVVTYRPAGDGAAHAFVWDHVADLGNARIMDGPQVLRDAQGRAVPDPFEAGAVLFTDDQPGVVMRIRARRRGGKRQVSEWAYADSFSLDNSSPPSMTIDDVPLVDTDAGLIEIDWTAFDDDSEDRNGNGALDLLDLEDRDNDGELDVAPVAVHFDYYRISEGETVPTSPLLLADLDWNACTNAAGEGDPDDGVASAPSGVGRAATFVWGYETDLGGTGFADGDYLIRGTPHDDLGNLGTTVYFVRSVTIDTGE